jgi:hypothetical protein
MDLPSPRVTSSPLKCLPGSPHDDADSQELLTVEDVATLLRVRPSWVYAHTRSRSRARSERLPYLKVGKYLRFNAGAVRAFLAKKCK